MSLKHRRNEALGRRLSEPLIELLDAQEWDIHLVVPIPLSTRRLNERGYNQIDTFGQPLSEKMDLPYSLSALMRMRETDYQVGLNYAQRWQNMRGSFGADSARVKGKRILLLDDIITTGATMEFASEALLEAGAKDVYVLTIARTMLGENADFSSKIESRKGG